MLFEKRLDRTITVHLGIVTAAFLDDIYGKMLMYQFHFTLPYSCRNVVVTRDEYHCSVLISFNSTFIMCIRM